MRVAADISLYPIADDFIPPIDDVIKRLESHDSIEVLRNAMSTQIVGDYDDVMAVLKQELGATFEATEKAVFVIKLLNNPINV